MGYIKKNAFFKTFFCGGVLGVIIFIAIYGWRFFRESAWHWPIGLMDSIAYPELTSIIYVDSVPLFNVIFKILNPFLPETFQFFGFWGILCFLLSGCLGAGLIYKITQNSAYSIIASVFFSLNNIMIQRLYTHTALAANWLILLCLLGIVANKDETSTKKQALIWAGLFFLCVSINMYYIPIIGILMVMHIVYVGWKHKAWKTCCGISVSAGISVCISFYLYGGFYHLNAGDAAPSGLGYYSANLNSLINPMETRKYLSGFSLFLKSLPMATDGQYEGYAYLGAGILLLLIIGIFGVINKHTLKQILNIIRQNKNELVCVIATIIILYIAALGTEITWNDKILFFIPYPEFLLKVYGIFRSTGRFLWGVWDIVVAAAIYILWKNYTVRRAIYILIFCVCIQTMDFLGMIAQRFCTYAAEQPAYSSSLSDERWECVLNDKTQIIMFNKQNLRLKTYYDLADKALKYDMGINDFYYSRRNTADINAYKQVKYQEVLENNASKKAMYIIDTFEDAEKINSNLNIYYLDGLLIGSKNEIDGMKKISSINPLDIICRKEAEQYYIDHLTKGTYGIELYGEKASEAKIFIDHELTPSLQDRYDGGSLGIGIICLTEDQSVVIEYGGEALNVKLYQLK